MRCPHCGHTQSRVIETREAEEAVRRRRECEVCQLRFTTYERPQFPKLVVRATSGTQRNFTKGWLATVLAQAGADLPEAALRTIATGIEAQLRATGRRVVSTGDIASVATREVGQMRFRALAHGEGPSVDQVTAALDATLPARKQASAQLPLPIER